MTRETASAVSLVPFCVYCVYLPQLAFANVVSL